MDEIDIEKLIDRLFEVADEAFLYSLKTPILGLKLSLALIGLNHVGYRWPVERTPYFLEYLKFSIRNRMKSNECSNLVPLPFEPNKPF